MVSIKATSMVIILLAFCLPDTDTVSHECCRSYRKTKIPVTAIKGYSVQTRTEICPINAIIFHTETSTECTNPALTWVMDYVNQLRNKAQMVHIKTSQEQHAMCILSQLCLLSHNQ